MDILTGSLYGAMPSDEIRVGNVFNLAIHTVLRWTEHCVDVNTWGNGREKSGDAGKRAPICCKR